MRQHICKNCGKIYITDKPDSWFCPACADESRRNIMRDKTCAMCGTAFVGYPRSKYCPTCRVKAKRENNRMHKKNGPSRKLGSTDICQACGKEYTVEGGLQRYCPECGKTVVAENVRAQSRKWNASHREELNAYRQDMRKDRRVCAVCGKAFSSPIPSVTCSPECAAEYKRQKQRIMDAKRRSTDILQRKK